jgi:hypothetical protein
MTKTKYVNPTKKEPKILTKTFRKKPLLSKSDSYYVHIPDNYMNNKDFPEDAEIKQSFIRSIMAEDINNKKLNAGKLNGICKEQHAITQNLKMQSNGNIVLYIEKNGDVKVAITIRLDFYTSEDVFDESEEEEEEEIPWRISQINILTFCSKEPGYGKKLINKIINLFYVGIDDGYILEDAKILLNYTASSKAFYEKLGFDCTDTHNELCYFDGNMIVPKKYRAGKKTKRNNKRGKTTRRQRRSNK